ncbi:TrbI/VirB10 family protein [uncultured Azohydromonas sp.]|jgi:Type IV secretory pathway, VirB10 components|uniref:TrbI/VirB10 family protein n=1 Tax=uncultured Azohydromonas sp. TaxID=487342 RepID=UPI0026300ACB|nr:TrbI/VirB10 family protein [uncultured Azohydromonas sp.]
MAQQDLLSPDASPGSAGVRRVNRVPIYLATGGLSLFVAVMASVAWQRAARQQMEAQAAQPTTAGTSSLSAAKAITGQYQGAVVPAAAPPTPPAPAPAASAVMVARPPGDDLDTPPPPPGRSAAGMPPMPPGGGGAPAPVTDPVADQIRQRRLQMAEQALQAPTTVKFALQHTGGGGGGAPASREEMLARLSQVQQQAAGAGNAGQEVNAAYQQRLAQLRAAHGGAGGSMPAAAPSRTGMAQFDGQPNRWAHDAQVLPPESPYTLLAGGVIPALLQDGINSELPGQIRGQVSRNVFDTATGEHLLIPQGTQLVGAYSSDVGYGQSRVVVAWQRLVFPDGKTLDLGAMPGADPAGYSGLSDKVNRHLVRTFASAFLMSGIVGGITYSQNRGHNQFAPTASSALSEALGQQLGQVTAQMIAKNLNLSPTLEIRPGFRFNVVVTKDLKFPGPYQPFDYQRNR